MNISDRKAFVCAVALHGLLFGAIIVLAWRSTTRAQAEPLPLIMEMVAAPADGQENSFISPPADAPPSDPAATQQPESDPAEPLLQQTDILPVAEQVFEDLKDVPPAPEPEPEPVAPPPPADTPSPKPAEKPKPVDKKPQVEAPKLMTREQFLKQEGLPKQARAPSQPRPTTSATSQSTRAPVRINTSEITRSLEGLLANSGDNARVGQMSASDQSALHAYLNRLRANIKRAWILPDTVSGGREWAEVLLTIEPNGTISNVRIGKHEGSKAFLDSIQKAVRAARSAGPTPSRQREYVRYTLNLRDM